MLKAEPSGGGYVFKAYDEDTGLPAADFSANIVTANADSIVGIIFLSWPNFQSQFFNQSRTQIDTPAAPIIDPNFHPFKTPVLIVPGVLGTDILKGTDILWANPKMSRHLDNFMDPLALNLDLSAMDNSLSLGSVIRKKSLLGFVSHYTDLLINDFISQGYTEGQDLFTFPYDWRFGVSEDAVNKLKSQIDYILTQTDAGKAAGKVEVVAHSTGGLIVKRYVKEHPTDHHIDKAVFVGVPNLGAPKAFKALINGDNFDVTGLDPDEMKKIAQNMPVVYDLAPSPQYTSQGGSFLNLTNPLISLIDQGKDLEYATAIQHFENQNLVNSQAVTNSQNLHTLSFDNYDIRNNGVDLYSLVGCKSGTFGKFTEKVQADGSSVYDFPKTVTGDGTVPFVSADSLPVDAAKTFFVPKVPHGDLMSANGSRQEIVNILTGSSLDTQGKVLGHDDVQQHPDKCQIKGDQIKIKSPVDIGVTDQAGNFSGLASDGSIQNDIPGADYEIWGDHKYVFLPTDEGQTYNISLKGSASGTFTLDDEGINGNSSSGEQVFSNLPVTTSLSGSLNLGGTDTLSLDTNGDGTVDQTVQPSATLNADQAGDLIPPVSTSTITGTMGQPGFYHSNATVTITSIDPLIPGHEAQTSGVLKTVYSLDGGATTTYVSALSVTAEGPHNLTFFSTDNAGNNEAPQNINFTIDKTAPELDAQFNPTTKDFDFSATDNQAPLVIPVCGQTQCTATDKAGNATVLNFTKSSLSSLNKNLVIKNISYNGQVTAPDANLLAILFSLSGSNIANLSQTELIKNQQILNLAFTAKQNQSVISDFTKGSKVQISTLPGMKILQIQTSGGKLKTVIK